MMLFIIIVNNLLTMFIDNINAHNYYLCNTIVFSGRVMFARIWDSRQNLKIQGRLKSIFFN